MRKLIFSDSVVPLGLTLFLFTFQMTMATTYYVDRNHASASNANPGTMDLPWLTIQHAAETLVAGDSVYVRTGIYNEHVYINNEGNTTDGYIVFSGYPNEAPVVDGTGVTESQNGITVDKSYIKLIGLEIRNWNDNGIWVERAGHIEISNCEIYNVANGIGMVEGVHDFVLNRVEMHHFDLYGFDASPYGTDCYNGTFNDCIAHTGRDHNQNVDGFAIGHGTQHDFTFNRCEAYDVYDGFDVGENEGSGDVNILLNRCSSHDCWNDGYKLTGHGTLINCLGYNNSNANVGIYWDVNAGSASLYNCTFYDTEVFNVWVENSNDALQMYNCILAGGDNIGLAFDQRNVNTYQGDYNLFQNDNADRTITVGYEDEFSLNQIESGAWTTYSGQDANSLVCYSAEDIFVDPLNFDLHLLETSNAINHGTNIGAPSDDYDGNPRPRGDGYDIGAYEYQGSVGVFGNERITAVPKTYGLSQNFPNPFNPITKINYYLPKSCYVSIKVFNVLGEEINILVDSIKNSGQHQVVWNVSDLSSGLYFYRMEAGEFKKVKKLIIQK